MTCLCLCLWFNHPAPSWLNFASSGSWQEYGKAGRWTKGWGPSLPCPWGGLPVGKVASFGCGFGRFWARGGRARADHSVSFVSFCCSSILYRCQEKGVRPLSPPNKLSHSEADPSPLEGVCLSHFFWFPWRLFFF